MRHATAMHIVPTATHSRDSFLVGQRRRSEGHHRTAHGDDGCEDSVSWVMRTYPTLNCCQRHHAEREDHDSDAPASGLLRTTRREKRCKPVIVVGMARPPACSSHSG